LAFCRVRPHSRGTLAQPSGADVNEVKQFTPEDLKRRRKRATVMALCLAALLVIVFITTIVKIYQAAHGVH
jgi:predicted nucleic acid-binding Zn ribbon protein